MKKILMSLFIIIALMLLIMPNCFAINGIKPEQLKPGNGDGIGIDSDLTGQLSGVVGIVQIVGVGIAAIACVLMGIRYVMSSVEEKADIKKKLTPYVIGAVIFFCATGILQMVSEVAKWFTE